MSMQRFSFYLERKNRIQEEAKKIRSVCQIQFIVLIICSMRAPIMCISVKFLCTFDKFVRVMTLIIFPFINRNGIN